MEAARIAAARTLNSTGWGWRIFSRDPLPSSTPMRMMTMDTTRPETYSSRPWPKGWSRSGSLAARWKPRSVTTEDPASERLLKASAVMAMEALRNPARSLQAKSRRFKAMPTHPHRTP